MSFSETLTNRFPTLSRHLQVFREAWRRQNDAIAQAKPRTDHEFLPAALEIMEKPPSPGLRYLLLSICGLFTVALLWSLIGKVDVIATATGKVIPTGSVKVVQPVELGYVRAIHVRNGQHVQAGQLLVELDPTLADAEEAAAAAGLLTSDLQAARNAAILAHLDGRATRFTPPPGTSAEVTASQRNYIQSSIAEYEAQRASLGQRRAQHQADLAASHAEIAKLERTLPLLDQQIAAREQLAKNGDFSRLKLLEYQQMRVEHVQNLEVQRANSARARALIAEAEAVMAQVRGTFGRTAVAQVVEGQDRSRVGREEVTKQTRRREYQQLRAPVSGTVQQLAISTVGGVVQPAQPIMVIVPDDAQPVVEAQILNRDIGFIREGQPVRIKLEAFPFTDYGIVPGVVETISRDAIDMNQGGGTQRDDKGQPAQQGLVYSARIRMLKKSIRTGGREQPIGPGLAVQAEIVTGKRRIIKYLLSPIQKTMDEAGRER
ncbi:MAG TPA: HlyD family type I secretion periplasmic adaptor subunit [Sphingomicrobium sp.]